MPSPVSAAISSMSSPYPAHLPITGSSNAGLTLSPYASARVNTSAPKPTMTNQCAAPTIVHLSIRVWPRVSASMVRSRAPLVVNRSGSGWPSRTTRRIRSTARTSRATATTVATSATGAVTSCTGPMGTPSGVRIYRRSIVRRLPTGNVSCVPAQPGNYPQMWTTWG